MSGQPAAGRVGQRIATGAILAVFDQVATKIGTTLIFVILVRMLPEAQIATLAVASGYLVLVSYFDTNLVRILLRDYASFAADLRERDTRFTAYAVFWLAQTAAIVLTCLLLQFLVFPRFGMEGLVLVFWALAADFVALSLQDWVKMAFYADLRQRLAVTVSTLLNVARLAAIAVIFLAPSLDTYAYVLMVTAVISSLIWIWLFQNRFRYRPRAARPLLPIIWQSVSEFTLWDHLNRLCIDTLFAIDTAILALLGRMEDLAAYSIALRLTSLMMLVPRQIMTGLQLALSRHPEPRTRSLFAGTYVKLNLLLCALQYAGLLVLAPWLITLLFGTGIDVETVTRFSLVIGLAVMILGFGLPMMGIVYVMGSIRDLSIRVFLPALVLGLSAYWVAGHWAGALGMAWANVVAYTFLTVGLTLAVVRNRLVRPEPRLLLPIEKRWLRRLLRRIGRR